jgi:hypothetical protein
VPPAGEHRHHDRVGGAQGVHQLRFGRPQRRAEHRQRAPAGRLDRVGQGVHEAGVAGQLVRAVVEHRDDGLAAVRPGRALQQPPGRRDGRRLETLTGQRDRIRQEPGELPQVLRTAVAQVGVRLGDDAALDGRQPHQFGVGRGLAAEHDRRHAGVQDPRQAVLPGPLPAEDAHHDRGGPGQQGGQLVEVEPGGIAEPVAGAAGRRRQQVGVGRRQQNDHGGS